MKLFDYTEPKMIVADKGKKIKDKNDVYEAKYLDEQGNEMLEKTSNYSTIIFVPNNFTEEMMNELYEEIEEKVSE